MPSFDELVAEGAGVPVEGWDFSWFDGRATEQRPSWGYARLMGERMAAASRALDLQTGGGEVLAGIPKPPRVLVATEGWPPNAALAAKRLAPLGGVVVTVGEDDAGLTVLDVRAETLRMEFFDLAAVIVFLRKVIWIVPGFTVDEYRDRLRAMHQQIQEHGPFVAHARRLLVEATKP